MRKRLSFIDYYDLEDVFEFCSGYESCVSQGNSRNRCVCQGLGEPEETCIEIGACP